MEHVHPVPKVIISVDRLAMYGKEDPNFRVTFDFNMRFRDQDLSLSKGAYGQSLVGPDVCLMEVKTSGALPLWLTQFLSEQKIYSRSFSKYGTYYKEHLLKKGELSRVG